MGFPSGYNTFIPSLEASGNLVVNYSRSPNSFPLNKYVGIKKVEKDEGKYLYISPDSAIRAYNPEKFEWADGAIPSDNYLLQDFEFKPYQNKRYNYSFVIGNRAVEQAQWDILAEYAAIAAQAAMTGRTRLVAAKLTDTANWDTHYGTATALGGGLWSAGTSADPYILLTLNAVARAITLATGGRVSPTDLQVVVNPTTAQAMNASAEIQDYLKGSYFARDRLLGDVNFTPWGPSSIYGFPLIVDNTVAANSNIGASLNPQFAIPDGYAVVLARPDNLVNVDSTFNTCTLFMSEEMTVESKLDYDNRRTAGRVVENFSAVVTASASGYLITSVT